MSRVIVLVLSTALACHRDVPASLRIAPATDTSPYFLARPDQPGPYGVEVVHYGSGADARRAHYGRNVDITTATVDLSRTLSLNTARRLYWNVSARTVPVNARVHLPVPHQRGERFPLILMAHGSHSMLVDSELGYDYLGRHLASRGFIFVSMDMNFLNPFSLGRPPGAMQARARLFLAHLAQWHAFDTEPGPLTGSVDLTRVVFVGHSRGGEAALAAAVLHEWALEFHDRFGQGKKKPAGTVRAVIALSPTDGRYPWSASWPATHSINYLVVHGSHDGDVVTFEGLRAFQRTKLSAPDMVKAAVFVHRGNHGQWNTRWGIDDRGVASRRLLHLAELLPARVQRDLARTLLAAFLDATVRDRPEMLSVFREYTVRRAWFPDIGLVVRFQTGDFLELASFARSDTRSQKNQSKSAPDVTVRVHGATGWTEELLPFRNRQGGHQNNRAAVLAWDGEARVVIDIAPGQLDHVEIDSFLHLAMAPAAAVDLAGWRIEIEDGAGHAASVTLATWTSLPPPLAVRLFRDADTERRLFAARADVILESVIVPVRAFVDDNPRLAPSGIRRVALTVRHAGPQRLYLDSIGFLP